VMAYRAKRRRGFGDVLNPTAGTALDCGLTNLGVFQKACWCLSFPSLCSTADYTAAYALAHPEVYAPVQAPPANPAVGAAYGNVAAPYTCAPGDTSNPNCPGYDAALALSAAQQKAAADAQNIATMNQTAANLKAAAQTQCPAAALIDNGDGTYSCPPSSGTNWLLYGGIALAAVFGLAVVGGGSPRRYGR
jgi:hypothetical protein